MDILFVYGLLILFALGVLLMVVVLVTDPNMGASPEEGQKEPMQRRETSSSMQSTPPNISAYAIVTVLLAFFAFLTFLTRKDRS
jgi:quinol-cytochrome oxidoreductase complex cytochrome b subunit